MSNKENPYILAMYDIRGKQNYIYSSTKMKEIVGASLIIRDCFVDYLFPAAKEVGIKGIFSYRVAGGEPFTEEGFRQHLAEGYLGEVVYDGGGNFLVLYKDVETCREINKLFYVKLLQKTYSLKVLTSYISDVNFDDFDADRKRLYDVHRRNEHRECAIHPVNALPIVQVDRSSSLPLAKKLTPDQAQGRKDDKVSIESKAKYDKYSKGMDRETEGARILDDMITKKGEDSHLAVIYIDGNSMGAKVQTATKDCDSYEDCVSKLREFSEKIQREYIDVPMDAIDTFLKIKYPNEEAKQKRRFVIYAGDEITFVCNARDAYDVVREYFKALNAGGNNNEINSSCAGVAIFHSHSPYADAYRIAEECCESGKKLMKERGIQNACFLDFHYCQGAVGTSLENIREHEGTSELCQPWRLDDFGGVSAGELVPVSGDIDRTAQLLGEIARSNGKTLLTAAKESEEAFKIELERIKAHATAEKLKNEIDDVIRDSQKMRPLIYRMMLVYDLWFSKSVGKNEDTVNKTQEEEPINEKGFGDNA